MSVERVTPISPVLAADERRWDYLWKLANVYSRTALVGKTMQGQPEIVMAGLLYCDAVGVDPRTSLAQLDLIEGHLEPRAQMYAAVAWINGYDLRPVETSDERAEVKIRDANDPDDDWLHVEFTIDQARQAHLLDEWVERRVEDGKWPDGNKKFRTEKFVIGRPGVENPNWALEEIAAGNVRHKDNWFNYPGDMLFARAAKRAIKRRAPHVMAGLTRAAQNTASQISVVVDDDEITDGELEPASVPRGPGLPPHPADLATPLERRAVHMLLDTLDDKQTQQLRDQAKAEEIPNIDGARITHDHAARLVELIDKLTAPSDDPEEGAAEPAADDNPEDPTRPF